MNNFFSPHSVKVRLLVPVGSPFPAAADSGGLPSSRQFPEWKIASCDLASLTGLGGGKTQPGRQKLKVLRIRLNKYL